MAGLKKLDNCSIIVYQMESRAGLTGIILLALVCGSLYLGYKRISDSAYGKGYDKGYSAGYESKTDEIRPVIEDALDEQQVMLSDFYTLQNNYNELRGTVDSYLASIGQYTPYQADVDCVSGTSFKYEYKGCML